MKTMQLKHHASISNINYENFVIVLMNIITKPEANIWVLFYVCNCVFQIDWTRNFGINGFTEITGLLVMLVSHIISAVHSTDRRLHFLFFTESFHGWPLGGWLLLFLTFSCLVYKVTFPSAVTMGVHVVGIVAVIVFYLMILGVGLWAARKSRGETDSENVMLAGRNIGILVGVFTMTGQCLWRSRTILFV